MARPCKNAEPKYWVSIEFEDDNYTYISSTYPYKKLKKDIAEIKVPITIVWN